jgi:hypothetical protein
MTATGSLADRHPSTQEKFRWLVPNKRLPAGPPATVAQLFADFAAQLLPVVGDGPQFTLALQQLIVAKDCAVRQAIADLDGAGA